MSPLLAALLGCAPSTPTEPAPPGTPVSARFGTFNISHFRDRQGALIEDLSDPNHAQTRAMAAILQEVRPDVLLLNEIDHDAAGEAVRLLRENFLGVGQEGREPLDYPYVWVPEVNTGVASGVDLDGDGQAVTTPGSQDYGDDALGFGEYPGQYGLVVLSRFPLGPARTFRNTLWKDVPGASIPEGFYSAEALDVLPLSSKTHGDVPVQIGGTTVHFLVSHPTPPSFDGDEDRNGRRNHDEITFWVDYLDGDGSSWQVDDAGVRGGLDGGLFVIAGDLNADPVDGDATGVAAMSALYGHPRTVDALPASAGGPEQAALQGSRNNAHDGDPALDTADFNESVGNLRVDHVIPSTGMELTGSGVFWPLAADPAFPLVGTFPFPVSDHRLVWVDLGVGG